MPCSFFGEYEVVLRVASSQRGHFTGALQLVDGEFPNSLEHREFRFVGDASGRAQQTFIHESDQSGQDCFSLQLAPCAHISCGGVSERAGKNTATSEQLLVARVEP